jgi:Domain of unknown function (DUF4387)
MTLAECATLIRSKNAGPFVLTFDVMLSSRLMYEHVKRSGVLTAERFAASYGISAADVDAFACDAALAFKFSIPRPATQGAFGDGDMHGGQQYAPLMEIEVPQL